MIFLKAYCGLAHYYLKGFLVTMNKSAFAYIVFISASSADPDEASAAPHQDLHSAQV